MALELFYLAVGVFVCVYVQMEMGKVSFYFAHELFLLCE